MGGSGKENTNVNVLLHESKRERRSEKERKKKHIRFKSRLSTSNFPVQPFYATLGIFGLIIKTTFSIIHFPKFAFLIFEILKCAFKFQNLHQFWTFGSVMQQFILQLQRSRIRIIRTYKDRIARLICDYF